MKIKNFEHLDKLARLVEDAFVFRFANPDKPLEMNYPLDPLNDFEGILIEFELSIDEIVAIALSLCPHLYPEIISKCISSQFPKGGDFIEIGGIKGKNHRGILPTGETLLFLIAGKNIEKRTRSLFMFDLGHVFSRQSILKLGEVPAGEPQLSGLLLLSDEWIELLLKGTITPPQFSKDFPAQLIETEMDWEDLIVSNKTQEGIQELKNWLEHHHDLLHKFNMKRMLKPGYRSLFFGPPGVGKTLAVSLLGKHINRPVYRIDLSMVVSKYIGETEKNLATLFKKAENKDWILFFDEADAIFGKRTNVRDAHDKYANQEVSYLLQRIENFNGLVILATNFKTNLDSAFARRFQTYVEFELPNSKQRLELWRKMLPKAMELCENCDLNNIAEKYTLSGSNILNVIQFAAILALKTNKENPKILEDDLLFGIRNELNKEGKL